MKKISLLCFIGLLIFNVESKAQKFKKIVSPQALLVSPNKRFLVYADGKPFFYLGDTAWELFHRLTLKEADLYMGNRKLLGFTVIQAAILAELDGLHTPNAYNNIPFKDDDPTQPNESYFKNVDAFIKLAASKGLYVGLLPTWGDKVFKNSWGIGPEVFNVKNAKEYGKFLGNRYKNYFNIIWILGGDRNPHDANDVAIWRSLAEGITIGVNGADNALITYHPQSSINGGISEWFHKDDWLDFNMLQTGHCKNGSNYDKISFYYALDPVKPIMDGEPLYEDHPVCFDWKKNGYSSADDIRKLAYWQLFAGAFGHTYGCHDIWQFFSQGRVPINAPRRSWQEALNLPGAKQMQFVKKLILSQSVLDRIPDQSLIIGENNKDSVYCAATRAKDGHYAFIYTPIGRPLKINTLNLKGKIIFSRWFNPRNGEYTKVVARQKQPELTFLPPENENDWVLILTEK